MASASIIQNRSGARPLADVETCIPTCCIQLGHTSWHGHKNPFMMVSETPPL